MTPTPVGAEHYRESWASLLAVRPAASSLTTHERLLVEVALAFVPTEDDDSRASRAIAAAREAGVGDTSVAEAIGIASVIGLHATTVGATVVAEALLDRGEAPESLSDGALELKRQFESAKGRPRPLDPMFEAVLRLDSGYFEAFVHHVNLPFTTPSALPARLVELIYIAIDAVPSHLFVEGLRRHVAAALDKGVEPATILEVLSMASVAGLRSFSRRDALI